MSDTWPVLDVNARVGEVMARMVDLGYEDEDGDLVADDGRLDVHEGDGRL